jgi:hypothetical protein
MPELVKWVNDHRYDGGRLSPKQKELRAFYARLLALVNEPAFRDGEFFALNSANIQNTLYGRQSGEAASGHWLYAFLRYDAAHGQRFLVLANLHGRETFHDIGIWLPREALRFLQVPAGSAWQLCDRLGLEAGAAIAADIRDGSGAMLKITQCAPLSACYYEWLRTSASESPP